MCLYIQSEDRPELEVADRDIVVFKILKERGQSYVTLYREYPVESRTIVAKGKLEIDKLVGMALWGVGCGLIHSYAFEGDAEAKVDVMSRKLGIDCFVAKAVIPKGTKYLRGRDDNDEANYASERIEII